MDDQAAIAPQSEARRDLAYLVEVGATEAALGECRGLASMVFEELGVPQEGVTPGRQVSLLLEVLSRVADENRQQAYAQRELQLSQATETLCFQVAAAAELIRLTDEALFEAFKKDRREQRAISWEESLRAAGKQGPATERHLRAAFWLGLRSAKSGSLFQQKAPAVLETAIREYLRKENAQARGLIADLARETESSASPKTLTSAVGHDSPSPPRHRTTSSKRFWVGIAVIVLVVASGAYFELGKFISNTSKSGYSRRDAVQLERRYDGKDPRGYDGKESKCSDPPPSRRVESSNPPVFGVDGKIVGSVELRTSPICPVIWARVIWNGGPNAIYNIPSGWTLHQVVRRPETGTRYDSPDTSSENPIQYGLSSMLVAVRGCVYVEVYFSKGERQTAVARSSCVTP